jgi:Zn-dependent protease/CBS domain-containing protein
MDEGNLRIGRIFGIPIEINYSWLIIFLLVFWSLSLGYFPRYYPLLNKGTYWTMGLAATLLLFLSVLLHEVSHAVVGRKVGVRIKKITLFIFGGVAQIGDEPKSARDELKIALAGPACSLFLLLAFVLLSQFLERLGAGIGPVAVTRYLAWINGVLLGFNLVPGFPLDGGRILRAAIWQFSGNLRRATFIASRTGKGFAYFLMAAGLLNVIFGANLVGGLWLLFIGFFLKQAAEMSYLQVIIKKALEHFYVRDVMQAQPVSVNENLTLQELVENYFFKFRYSCFPVMSQENQLVGLITLGEVKEIERDKWSHVRVKEIMKKATREFTTSPGEPLDKVFNKVMSNELGRLCVTEGTSLVGIITHRDVMKTLRVITDLGH